MSTSSASRRKRCCCFPIIARLLQADPLLREQLARAAEASAAEQKAAQAAIKQVEAMRKTATEELRALRELLGVGNIGQH